jgi:hypothetical protein
MRMKYAKEKSRPTPPEDYEGKYTITFNGQDIQKFDSWEEAYAFGLKYLHSLDLKGIDY